MSLFDYSDVNNGPLCVCFVASADLMTVLGQLKRSILQHAHTGSAPVEGYSAMHDRLINEHLGMFAVFCCCCCCCFLRQQQRRQWLLLSARLTDDTAMTLNMC